VTPEEVQALSVAIRRGVDMGGKAGWLIEGEDVGVFRTKADAAEYVRVIMQPRPAQHQEEMNDAD
jgi:hypothetical protein